MILYYDSLFYGRKPADFPAGHGNTHGIDEAVSLDRLQQAVLALNEMERYW